MSRPTAKQSNPFQSLREALQELLVAMIDNLPFGAKEGEEERDREQCLIRWREANFGSAERLFDLVSNARRSAEKVGLPSEDVEAVFELVWRAQAELCKWGSTITPRKFMGRVVKPVDLGECLRQEDVASDATSRAQDRLRILEDRYASRVSAMGDYSRPPTPTMVKAKGEIGPSLTDAEAMAVRAEKLALQLGREDGSLSSDSTDEDVFNWLNDHHDDESVKPVLPESLTAFKRNLGRARNKLGTRKRRRAGLSGKSVVRTEDVEPVARTDD